MGAREDKNTLDMITKKLQGIKSEQDVGALVASILDEKVLAEHAVATVGDMVDMVKGMPEPVGRLILGTAFTIGFATGVEFNRISRAEVQTP